MEETNPKRTNKIDYANTPISFYKFVCEDEDVVSTYVGHTANFTRRKCQHKSYCSNEQNKKHNYKIYQTIRENGGWDNWKMIEIKSQLCENKRHAERIEQELMGQYKAELNSNKAFSNDYYLENKEKIAQRRKQHYQDNKDENIKKRRQYYSDNKEKLDEYYKQYRLDNKEKIVEQNRQYRLKKKQQLEEIKELV